MKRLFSLLFACLAFTFTACEEEVILDTKGPAVLISSPSEETEFEQHEDITFESTITDDSGLESVTLSIAPPGGSTQLVHSEPKENFSNDNKEVSIKRTLPISMAGGLAPGRYLLIVQAGDIHGNKTEDSIGIYILEAETEKPLITFSHPTEGAVFTPDEEIVIQAAITDNTGLASASLSVSAPNGEAEVVHTEDFTDNSAEVSVRKALAFESPPATGTYLLTLEAADTYGNKSSETVTIHIRKPDTKAPVATISNPTEGREFHTDDIISFEARATDETELDSVKVHLRGPNGQAELIYTQAFAEHTTEANIRTTFSLGSEAVAGDYTLTTKAVDAAGNTTEEGVNIHVKVADAELPLVAIHSPTAGAVFTPDEAIPLEAGLTDNKGLASVSIRLTPPEGQPQEVHTEEFTGNPAEAGISKNISLGDNPATGNYLLTVEASDTDGHSREKSVMVEVREPDLSSPAVQITNPVDGTEFYADEDIYLQADVADNAGLEEVTVWVSPPGEEAQLLHTESPDDFFNNEKEAHVEKTLHLGAEPAAGTYTLAVRATDKAGNTTEETVSIRVLEADTQAPVISVHSPEGGSTYAPGDEVGLNVTIEDNQQLAEIRVRVTLEGAVTVYDNTITEFDSATSHQVQDTATIPTDASSGTYYVTITATDAAGNIAKESLTFQVNE